MIINSRGNQTKNMWISFADTQSFIPSYFLPTLYHVRSSDWIKDVSDKTKTELTKTALLKEWWTNMILFDRSNCQKLLIRLAKIWVCLFMRLSSLQFWRKSLWHFCYTSFVLLFETYCLSNLWVLKWITCSSKAGCKDFALLLKE